MIPEIIIHNSISLDGSLTGFMPEMDIHYSIAARFSHEARLIGSETIRSGIDMFGEGVPDELPSDFKSPNRNSSLPWWIIVDSEGKLKGMLHTCRRFEYCRDVIVLVSEKTPADYISHLEERNYRYMITGTRKVDIKEALDQLSKVFGIKKILTDTGRILGNLLLNKGLVSEISLLVHPLLTGNKGYYMFSDTSENISLHLIKSEKLEKDVIWVHYRV